MKLLINTSLLRFGGAVQGATSMIGELRGLTQHEYHVVLGPGVKGALQASCASFPDNFSFYETSFGVMGLSKVPRVHSTMSELEARIRPDCVLTTSGPAYWRSRAPHLIGYNLPLYIYPESPYVKSMPRGAKARLAAKRWLHRHFFRRDADALIVQTDDVNRRVRTFLGTNSVHTVSNNHGPWFDAPQETAPRLPQRRNDTFRFLTMTSYYPHKNLELIPELLRALPTPLRERVEFVLTLSEEQYRRHIGHDIPTQVRPVGPVPPHEAPSLYMEVDALFHPTLAECFSAAYPEAMVMGKPIITTDLGFARGICQSAALYFSPRDATSAALQVDRLVNDVELQHRLVAHGLERLQSFDSPLERAQKIVSICEQLAAARECVRPARWATRHVVRGHREDERP